MWKRKDYLWVPEGLEVSPPKPKVADRPHWITVLIGLGTITSAVVGLTVITLTLRSLNLSEKAVQTSQQSMRIGQRAYISISQGTVKMDVRGLVKGETSAEIARQFDLGGDHVQFVSNVAYGFVITNLGNTPAQHIRLTFHYFLPSEWSVFNLTRSGMVQSDRTISIELPSPGDIGPKISHHYHRDETVKISTEGVKQLRNLMLSYDPRNFMAAFLIAPPLYRIKTSATLTYTDVFDEKHKINWCWVYRFISDYPTNCEADTSDVR